jgi:predicted metal-binding protein
VAEYREQVLRVMHDTIQLNLSRDAISISGCMVADECPHVALCTWRVLTWVAGGFVDTD